MGRNVLVSSVPLVPLVMVPRYDRTTLVEGAANPMRNRYPNKTFCADAYSGLCIMATIVSAWLEPLSSMLR